MLVAFLWSYIFTRTFGPEEYGLYGLVIAITGPLVTILVEWAAQPIGRFYAEYDNKNQLDIYYSILKKLTYFILIICSLIILIFIGSIVFLEHQYVMLILPATLSVVFNSITTLYLPILPASLNATLFRRLQVWKNIFRLIIACLLVFGVSENIYFLVWADMIAALVFVYPLLKSVKPKLQTTKINNSRIINLHFKKFLRYGIPMMLWFLCSQLLNVGDRFVIQQILGEKAVGIYTANYLLINGVAGLLNAPISLAAFPLVMKQWAEGNEYKIGVTINKMTTIYCFISICIISLTAVSAKEIVTISLGEEYTEGYQLLTPLVAGLVIWQATMLGHKGMELKHKTLTMVYLIVVAALINIILNLVLIPYFGYEAAAWTTLISYFIYAFLIWILSGRYIKWVIDYKIIATLIVFALLSSLIAMKYISVNIYLSVIFKSTIFILIYFTLVATVVKFKKKNIKSYLK